MKIITYFLKNRSVFMKKILYFLILLIVAGSFIINIFVDNESISTIVNIIGLIAIIIMGIVLRIPFGNSSEK
jgi:FtsH-binding integral membrane protein